MPLNKDERKMKRNLEDTYGKAAGKKVFYAMERQGKTPNSSRRDTMMDKKKKGYAMGGMVMDKGMQSPMGMGAGGMTKKTGMGYAKGGMVKCGASNPATQKGTKK